MVFTLSGPEMERLLPDNAVVPFVREVLGCNCPAEVFRTMDVGQRALSGVPCQRVLVGRRLLVYLVDRDVLRRGVASLEVLLEEARRERGREGYNRLRIVIVGESDPLGRDAISDEFLRCLGRDDRAHIHFVTRSQLRA